MDENVNIKNIFAISLDSKDMHHASAMLYDRKRLVITECKPITGAPHTWRTKLLDDIENRAKHGFSIIVEDRSGTFSPYADAFCFDDKDEDGRTMLIKALDWYLYLQNTGNLILDPMVERFAIKTGEGGSLQIDTGKQGKTEYHTDYWFGGAQKALLLCVAAAFFEEPLSDRWMNAMLAALPRSREPKWNLLQRWGMALAEIDAATERRLNKIRMLRQEALDRKESNNHGIHN